MWGVHKVINVNGNGCTLLKTLKLMLWDALTCLFVCFALSPCVSAFVHLILGTLQWTFTQTDVLTDWSALSCAFRRLFVTECLMSFTSGFHESRVFMLLKPEQSRTDAVTFHSSPSSELMNHIWVKTEWFPFTWRYPHPRAPLFWVYAFLIRYQLPSVSVLVPVAVLFVLRWAPSITRWWYCRRL